MKKLISVALALTLVFTLALSAFAADVLSPTGKEYWVITTATDPADGSLGTAATNKPKVLKTATGEDAEVTLTATQTKGFFTLWDIDGDYEIVDGDEESPVLVIIPKSDIHAIACFTVEEDYLNMTVSVIGDGTATVNPAKVKKGSGDLVTFEATDGKDTFVNWTLECKYDIVEGSLTSRKLVIRPYTDVHGIALFQSSGSSSAIATPDTPNENKSGTSPKTGDPLWIILGLAVLALGAGALAVKKIKE